MKYTSDHRETLLQLDHDPARQTFRRPPTEPPQPTPRGVERAAAETVRTTAEGIFCQIDIDLNTGEIYTADRRPGEPTATYEGNTLYIVTTAHRWMPAALLSYLEFSLECMNELPF